MIRTTIWICIMSLTIFNFGCGGKKSPDTDTEESTTNKTELTEKINERTRIEETNESLEKTKDQNNQKLKVITKSCTLKFYHWKKCTAFQKDIFCNAVHFFRWLFL